MSPEITAIFDKAFHDPRLLAFFSLSALAWLLKHTPHICNEYIPHMMAIFGLALGWMLFSNKEGVLFGLILSVVVIGGHAILTPQWFKSEDSPMVAAVKKMEESEEKNPIAVAVVTETKTPTDKT